MSDNICSCKKCYKIFTIIIYIYTHECARAKYFKRKDIINKKILFKE